MVSSKHFSSSQVIGVVADLEATGEGFGTGAGAAAELGSLAPAIIVVSILVASAPAPSFLCLASVVTLVGVGVGEGVGTPISVTEGMGEHAVAVVELNTGFRGGGENALMLAALGYGLVDVVLPLPMSLLL